MATRLTSQKKDRFRESFHGYRWLLLFASVLIAGLGVQGLLQVLAAPTGTVSGVVVDSQGLLAGARVRVRATENLTFTDNTGRFTLIDLPDGQMVEIAAWSPGYYIASELITPTTSGVTLTLRPYHTQDHPDYQWTSPISGTSPGACGFCHPAVVPQWLNNAHGRAISNERFFSMYNGTDVTGLLPVAPGFLQDFPDTAGICAECHAPGAGVDNYLTVDMNTVRDVITAGVHCDYCHKIGGVYLDPVTQSVYPNAPGTRSQRVLRPPAGDNIFFGPYDDIHDPDTYLPEISESRFCAPCHQFSMWGTPIYESYEEWLATPYAAAGVTCQDCHMPPNGDNFYARPEVGGLSHPPETIPSHQQLGARDLAILTDTASLSLTPQSAAARVAVHVTITNTGAGHHLPTDYPGRHVLLLVSATTSQGEGLPLISGPTIPFWGGDEAGKPGKGYAKIMQDVVSSDWPVVSYWKQTRILTDTRLPALAADSSNYIFLPPTTGGQITITVKLVLRHLFQPLADAKGWTPTDLTLTEKTLVLDLPPGERAYLPVLLKP